MSTRYMVEWQENGEPLQRGFAFAVGAFELFGRLVASEGSDTGSGITGAALRYLGPNGERHEEPIEVSPTFSKGCGGMGGEALP